MLLATPELHFQALISHLCLLHGGVSSFLLCVYVHYVYSSLRPVRTGTPIENKVDELHSIFDFVNYGYLGDKAQT